MINPLLVLISLVAGYYTLGYTIMSSVYNSTKSRNPLNFETRRIQSNGRSLVTVLPKIFTDRLGIERGDLIKFTLHAADKRKLVLEKINIDNGGYDPGATPIGM